jgi:hypothetical protein
VREGADVGADGEGNAGGHLFFELGGVEVELVIHGLAAVGGVSVPAEVFADGEGGHGVDLLVVHELHRLRRE